MKKYLYKILSFAVLLLLLLQLTNLVLPYYWFVNSLDFKVRHLQQMDEKPDTYFFGSSLTQSQIQPLLFDSLTGLHSFNLGVDGMRPPDSFFALEDFIDNEVKEVKYVFLELTDIIPLREDKMDNLRMRASMNWRKWWFNYQYFKNERDWKSIRLSIQLLLGKICKYQIFHAEKEYIIDNKNKFNKKEKQILNNRGFISMENRRKKDKVWSKDIIQDIFNDSLILAYAKKQTIENNRNKLNESLVNPFFINKIHLLNQKVKHLNGQLILIIPHRADKNIINYTKTISSIPIINLSHPNQYPEFYQMEYSSNISHLNKKGSDLYTQRLAHQFLESK